MNDILLEPLAAYKDFYARGIEEKARERINELVARSGIDVEANRATSAQFRAESAALAETNGNLSKLKTLRVFAVIGAVVAFLIAVIGIVLLAFGYMLAGSLMLVLGVAAGVGAILAVTLDLNGKIKHGEAKRDTHAKSASDLAGKAWAQVAPLSELFDSADTKRIIESVVPSIKIDNNFNMRRYDYLCGKYGLGDNTDENSSTVDILTGEVSGNPFMVERDFVMKMGTFTYTGSITIHWTTTEYDSEGHAYTEHHSETLTAHVTKPKPYYSMHTRLIYGNDAAPDLCFTHTASHAERLDEKSLERAVKSGIKKIRKQQSRSIESGTGTFTEMGNEQFDALFGALDRNHEVQFRLLFTPLGQKNMLELMKSKIGYGDDFDFYKRGCLNYIISEHSQNQNLDTTADSFASYDVDIIIDKYVRFNANYFKSLFFDLAPLLAIPLYSQHKPQEFIYKDVYERNYTSYEAERAVNRMGQKIFAHEDAATESILKTVLLKKSGKTDEVGVTAYAFRTEEHVEYVSEWGGDGSMHEIPVHWTEYIPVCKQRIVGLKELGISDRRFFDYAKRDEFCAAFNNADGLYNYSHGLLCCLCNDGLDGFDERMDRAFEIN